jgi:hypothetical protein
MPRKRTGSVDGVITNTPRRFIHFLAAELQRAAAFDADKILELTRAFFVDEAPRSTESHGLSMLRHWVRKWLPGVRLLASYSDPAQGHTGAIYAADGSA